MALAIGIDTGGTYTDGVVFDLATQKTLAKTKVLTTYEDLTIGIRNCISSLGFTNFETIKMVSLSTTLATNALVEGRGSEVGLILIGDEPLGSLPVKHYAVIPGGHDLKGNAKEALDIVKAQEALLELKDNVNAIAISGFLSVRNPEHELQVKELAEKTLGLPIVCGHQLTTSLGFHERSVTAALNAKLLPIIANLVSSVKQVLLEKDIHAKLMIVKGDGTLMDEATSLEKPIETILSGPAASIIGATTLTKASDALILDMGGTTSDIAILKQGIPRLNQEGARVGGWLTRVQAANINTFGIGGDSYIRLSNDNELLIGPQKVTPLSVAGEKYPHLIAELQLQWQNFNHLRVSQITDCYFLIKDKQAGSLTSLEKNAIELLKSGAHSLLYIANALNKHPFSVDLQLLVDKGILGKAALTPTDILHVEGSYVRWNEVIAKIGTNIIAKLTNQSLEEVIETIKTKIVDKLCLTILESLIANEGRSKDLTTNLQSNYYINKILSDNELELFSLNTKINVPIIGIGAPVQAYLPLVAERLNAELIIPRDSEVANAIGAAAGNIIERVEVLINTSPEGYVLFSKWERKGFNELDEAKEYALTHARAQAILAMDKIGISDYQINEQCEDRYTNGNFGTYLETRIGVTITGRPEWDF